MASGGSNVLLTPDQAAGVLGVTKRSLMDCYRKWGLPHVRVGKHVRFRERDLLHWIDKHTVRP